jgi:hypothetical protein
MSATFKYARRAFQQAALPLMDQRRVNPETACQLAGSFLTFQRF